MGGHQGSWKRISSGWGNVKQGRPQIGEVWGRKSTAACVRVSFPRGKLDELPCYYN